MQKVLEKIGTDLNVVGKSVLKKDAVVKVTGEAKFGADLKMPNMLYTKVLRSPIPHGIVTSIDISEALALKGVVKIALREDIPGENSFGIVLKDEPVLVGVGEKVRKIGDALAAVAAESEAIAAEAVKLIKVSFDELPIIDTIEKALAEGAPAIQEAFPKNQMAPRIIEKGDVDEAFKHCAYIVEDKYKTHMVDHSSIEPESGVAVAENGGVTVYCSTQNVHYDRKDVSRALKIPAHKTRIIQTYTGGGFGGKLDISVQILISLLAILTKRPVKYTYTREEHMFVAPKRHPYFMTYKTGVDKEGKILAQECTIYGDSGAYISYGPAVLTRAAVHSTGPYNIPHTRVRAHTVITNNPTAGAMRGFGVPQVVFAMETQMDRLAKEVGISPYEIRRINTLEAGSITSTGQELHGSVGILETLEKAYEKSQSVFGKGRELKPSERRGVGIGCMHYGVGNTGLPNPAGAFIEFHDDATAVVLAGCADIGQGSNTVLAQIAAEELGIDFDDVHVVSADTGVTPDGGATSASRQTYISGNAVQLAAKEAKENVLLMAGEKLGVEPENLVIKNKEIFSLNNPTEKVGLVECLGLCRSRGILTQGSGWFNPDTTGLEPTKGTGSPYATYAYGTHIAEVIVDMETGQIEVETIVAAHDVGQAINPKQVEGQIEGGCSFGIGYATFEELKVEGAKIVSPSLATYLLATARDMPDIYSIIVEDPEVTGPFGAKGIGEPTLIPTAAAIANAVSNATGVYFTQTPLSPEKILARLGQV